MTSWTRLRRVTAPSPIMTLAQAKAHLNVFHTDDDDLITSLIEAATAAIDGPSGIGIALGSQSWRMSLDAFPNGVIRIPLNPVTAITSITYGSETLDADEYGIDLDQTPAVIYPILGSWPYAEAKPGLIKVTFTAGDASPPRDLIQAVKLMIGHWFRNKEAASDKPLREVPLAVESILARHRVTGIA